MKENSQNEHLDYVQKEAIEDLVIEKARYLISSNYDEEDIAFLLDLNIEKIQSIKGECRKLELAKQLKITKDPQYIEDSFIFGYLPKEIYVKRGKMIGAENMLILGLHAIGLDKFLGLLSRETKKTLFEMLYVETIINRIDTNE